MGDGGLDDECVDDDSCNVCSCPPDLRAVDGLKTGTTKTITTKYT